MLIWFHKIHLEKKMFAPFGLHKSTEIQFQREAAWINSVSPATDIMLICNVVFGWLQSPGYGSFQWLLILGTCEPLRLLTSFDQTNMCLSKWGSCGSRRRHKGKYTIRQYSHAFLIPILDEGLFRRVAPILSSKQRDGKKSSSDLVIFTRGAL